ncbi:glycosyltransferase family 2 protein [Roseovarius dicentrarchi]|uniref:glycosyltransferase family 2 protein n=1 Tax=Roseovarius dicentrarchi TaxID=2250573 RepID=UPI001396707A|nr:glycosyltransferase family 2 protein [Roseovarius dicentrarchi]
MESCEARAASEKRVAIVSVCHNSAPVLASMLETCPRDAEIILVDNASADTGEIANLAKKYNTGLILNKANKGFGAACNQGASASSAEFILFLNPDAQLMPDTIQHLVTAADKYAEASAFNPRIQRQDGLEAFNYKSDLLPRSRRMNRGWPSQDCETVILSGAALFIRRSDFVKVNGFDENIFLYYEDDDLSLRLKRQCGPLMFCRAALVKHIEGASSGKSSEKSEAFKAWHKGRSKIYTMGKHARPFARTRTVAHALKKVLSVKLLYSGLRRSHSVAFLKGVLHASFTKPRAPH